MAAECWGACKELLYRKPHIRVFCCDKLGTCLFVQVHVPCLCDFMPLLWYEAWKGVRDSCWQWEHQASASPLDGQPRAPEWVLQPRSSVPHAPGDRPLFHGEASDSEALSLVSPHSRQPWNTHSRGKLKSRNWVLIMSEWILEKRKTIYCISREMVSLWGN